MTRRGRSAVLSCTVTLAVVLAGCGSSDGDERPSEGGSTAPAASATPDEATTSADPQAAEKAAVVSVYEAMWIEQMKAYRVASAEKTDLEKYATLDALGQFRNDLAQMRKAGTVVRGELSHENTQVTALDMDAKIPKATLQDCMNISKWQTYSTKRDEVIPLPSNQPRRYMATATAERWDGQWMVTTFSPDGKRPC